MEYFYRLSIIAAFITIIISVIATAIKNKPKRDKEDLSVQKNLENTLEILENLKEAFKLQGEELIKSKEENRKLKKEILLLKSEINKETVPQFENSFKNKEFPSKNDKALDDEVER